MEKIWTYDELMDLFDPPHTMEYITLILGRYNIPYTQIKDVGGIWEGGVILIDTGKNPTFIPVVGPYVEKVHIMPLTPYIAEQLEEVIKRNMEDLSKAQKICETQKLRKLFCKKNP